MGSSRSGLYQGTYGSKAVAASSDYMDKNDAFSKYIKNRKDIDVNGFYDIIAHGEANKIIVEVNGKRHALNHRDVAKLIKSNVKSNKKNIRLLSCSTGEDPKGFAQNLANKLNIVVEAPTSLLWVYPNGKYVVAPKSATNSSKPNLKAKGRFKKFYPGGKKK